MSDWASQKSAGNSFYTSGNVDAAVSAYTTALADEELPSAERATILCNRAQCFLKNKAWTSAVEDCTACLMVAPNNVKALFRRACALEALGEKKDALRDFRAVVALNASIADAVAGVRRLETELGERPAAARRESGQNTGRVTADVSAEDAKQLDEAGQQVRDVAVQKAKAKEQDAMAKREKRQLELTISQMSSMPAGVETFRPIGKMFMRTPRDELTKAMAEKLSKAEHKIKVCVSTLEYIERQEKEAAAEYKRVAEYIMRKQAAA